MNFDQALMEQGLKLTAFGMGTAFAILLLLTFVILLIGRLFGPDRRKVPDEVSPNGGNLGQDAHNKALAAAIAVSALVESHETMRPPGSSRS